MTDFIRGLKHNPHRKPTWKCRLIGAYSTHVWINPEEP